jgi:hypothetical protein
MTTLLALRALLGKVPSIVWLALGILTLAVSGYAYAYHRGQVHARVEVTRIARRDSLKDVRIRLAPVIARDTAAGTARTKALAVVHRVQAQRGSHHAATPTSDTSVVVHTAGGQDSSLAVHPEIVQTLREDRAQIVADSLALLSDSTKFATLAERAPLDSTATVLSTRTEDDAQASGGSSVTDTLTVVGVIVAGLAALFALFHR